VSIDGHRTNGVETLPKILIACVGCTNLTDRRQTDGRTMTCSERERSLKCTWTLRAYVGHFEVYSDRMQIVTCAKSQYLAVNGSPYIPYSVFPLIPCLAVSASPAKALTPLGISAPGQERKIPSFYNHSTRSLSLPAAAGSIYIRPERGLFCHTCIIVALAMY